MADRDGFVIRSIETDEEIDFIRCERSGPFRDRVENGLAMKVDTSRFYWQDTRDSPAMRTTEARDG